MVAITGLCGLLMSLALPVEAQTSGQTSRELRPGAEDARRGSDALSQKRAQDQARQSREAETRARATQQRQLEMKRQTDQSKQPR
jgi:hypothetical protein